MHSFWVAVSFFGEFKLLAPIAVAAALCMSADATSIATRWLAGLTVVGLITLVSQLAYLGWRLGVAEWNFTGFSGHATAATAIYPVLGYAWGNRRSPLAAKSWALAGLLFAVLIGMSRVALSAHSITEVAAGWVLGGAVTAIVLLKGHKIGPVLRPTRLFVAFALACAIAAAALPQMRTHNVVIALALALSDKDQPYTRADLHRPPG